MADNNDARLRLTINVLLVVYILNFLDRQIVGILAQPIARKFLNDWHKLIATLLPHYVREGKSYLTIAVGCTGGRHRSVFCTRWLAQKLRATGHPVQEFHRDVSL